MKTFLFFCIQLLFCIFSIAQGTTNFKTVIGKTYNKINEINLFSNYIESEGLIISELKNQKKGLVRISKDDHSLVLFTQYTKNGNKILALLDLGNILRNEIVVLRECRISKKKDNYIIAVLDPQNSKLYFTNIRKAWRLDPVKKTFNPIPIKGIDCLNEEFYNEN